MDWHYPHQLPTTTVPPKIDPLFRQRARKKCILKHFQPVASKLGLFGDMHWCRLLKSWSLRWNKERRERKKDHCWSWIKVFSESFAVVCSRHHQELPEVTLCGWQDIKIQIQINHWDTALTAVRIVPNKWNVSLFSSWFLWSGPFLETKSQQKRLLFSCMFGAWNCRFWCSVFWGTCCTEGKAFFVVVIKSWNSGRVSYLVFTEAK